MFRRPALAALVTIAMTGVPASVTATTAQPVNQRPPTIPALREWRGSRGYFRLAFTSRIIVAGQRLRDTALVFASDLRALTRRRLKVAGPHARPRRGDIILRLVGDQWALGTEGYALRIGATTTISARDAAGVFYGTRTLLQLLSTRRPISRGVARDWPRYPQRGLMIDLGRRVYPARWIESEIKQLAYLKLNVLHLHLTDDQRWGIASSSHPEIVSAHALSKRDVRKIVATATRYHVLVVPEIDMPGHIGALLAKHPELELKIGSNVKPPPSPDSRKLDISSPRALHMVRQLLDEYLPLFPGRYWDVGADEYLTPAEEALYPQLLEYARRHYGPRATVKDSILGFINWVDGIARRHGKTLWAWHDELGNGGVLRANPDIVAGWWTNVSPLSDPQPPTPAELLAAGHRILNEGWFPTYYTEDIGPIQGKPDMRRADERWAVNQFCGPTVAGRMAPCFVVSPNERRNLGSTINAWDNHELTLAQIAHGLFARLRVIAQKTWDSPELTPSYAGFLKVMREVGQAP